MSNDKKTSTTNVAQKVEINSTGNGATFVQNGVITNIFNSGKVDTSVDGKTPQTITVKPNTEQQPPKIDWPNVLPDAQAVEVKKILENKKPLDLHTAVGIPMVDIENREKLKQGNKPEVKKPEVNNPANNPTSPQENNKKPVATVGLDSFSKTEQQALAYKTGDVDPDSSNLKQKVSAELQNDGVVKNVGGKPRINIEALKKYNPNILDKTDGKTLSSLDQDTREYIQTILGVKPDGVVGPITLGTAQKKGILNVDGTVNAEKLKEATINAEHLKAEEKKYWNNTIQGNIAQENASKKSHGKTSDPDLELRRFFNETFELNVESIDPSGAVVPMSGGNGKSPSKNPSRR
jgi:hypothetical protein